MNYLSQYFLNKAAHIRVAGTEQERVAFRAVADSSQKELLQEDEEDCGDEADEGSDVVPLQALAFEEEVYDYRKDYQ